MNTNKAITTVLFLVHVSPLATISLPQQVSFVNSSSQLQVEVGREAVLECLIQNLANNHLVSLEEHFSKSCSDW